MKKYLFLILCILTVFNILGQKSKISIANTPDWVSSIENLNSDNNQNNDSSGYYYHLIDQQINLDKQHYYYHYTVELINNEGIQQIPDINIDFDPTYQQLIFHKINIVRAGKPIIKLSMDQIKTVQREANMERFLYDGMLTAFINLSDVRIGDIVDYSYTLVGSNPVYENKYHSKLYFQYPIPVGVLYNRLVVSENRKLHFKYFNNAPLAIEKNYNGLSEYSWKNKNISPIVYDIGTPSWYNPSPAVSISEYSSWNEVVDQYQKHYQLNTSDTKTLHKNATRLFSKIPKDSLVNKIRKFVQDDIRYLGFEGGLNSHKPNNPIDVLNQRYGDCKAKSFLLSELYKVFKIEAHPILVSSYNGKNIEDELPSPNLFNHCIVQVKFNEGTYYIDPTISNQGGSLENLYVPDYQKGLVLNNEEVELSDINSTSENVIRIIEEFDIKTIGEGGDLTITTKYSGYYADDQRVNFAKKDFHKIQKEYLNFYSTIYPSIKESSKIEITDHRENRNEIIIKESYSIDSLWSKSTVDDQILTCEFYPLNIETYVNLNKSPKRTMPYLVQYPVDIEHQIVVNLPEEWYAKQQNTIIKDDSFVYAYDINYYSKKIKLTHSYKTLKNYLEADEVSSFISKHDQILNGLPYVLTYNKNLLSENSGVSWILILISLFIISVSVYFAIKIYKNYDVKIKQTTNSIYSKIGGWLILIAIGLSFTPLRIFYDLIKNFKEFYGTNTWNYITQKHNSFSELFSSMLIIFELIYNLVFIVFSILLIILFFKRRSITPRMMIIFYSASFIVITADSIIAFGLNEFLYSEAERVQTFKEIAKSFIKMIIWIPYFLVSKRVKSTFVEVYNKKKTTN
ncbi:DUF2569 family protein [Aquimarina sp. RZ0]|uniref:DUF2569 family protein n=1 Tax=Aquimarina sp. RZ0 TaxID=2607730 RepID=UPI0011F40051|nr:DUF2569 family protein [Aquimarina sp. RZ0]KAA1247471.1 DUF2569 family protein [Aquimarina sp. RZ0]